MRAASPAFGSLHITRIEPGRRERVRAGAAIFEQRSFGPTVPPAKQPALRSGATLAQCDWRHLLLDDTASKRLELIKEAIPRVQRTAFLWNPDHPDNELVEAQRAAPALSMELQLVELRGPKDIEVALRTLSEARPDALYVVSSRHTVLNIPRIVEFAKANRIPLAGGWGAWARAGGLLSFGPNTTEMAQRAAEYVDKIIKGAKPADLPI